MRPPVALGPHQLQSMTGGLGYTDGIVDVNSKQGAAAGVNAEKVRIDPRVAGVYGGGGGGGGGDGEKEGKKKEKKRWIVKERT